MTTNLNVGRVVFAAMFMALAAGFTHAQTGTSSSTYSGNGNTSFGGAVGTGTLLIANNTTGDLNFTYTRGSSNFDNALVIYINSASGGATSTSTFTDTGDGLRRAISGFSGTDRSELNFAAGFGADYAVALNSGFAGLWNLSNTSSFTFVKAANLNPTGSQTAPSYTFAIDVEDIGMVPGSGAEFTFFTSYISETAFRSVETFGASYSGSPSAGWNTFSAASSNTFVTAPEPSSAVLAILAMLGASARTMLQRRRQLHS